MSAARLFHPSGPLPAHQLVTPMTSSPAPSDPRGASALRTAEAALSRIERSVDAAQAGEITLAEALEQITDELVARPALGRVREALSRSFSPSQPH